MSIRNIKITFKLAISAAAFILPLGIMLFSIISISVESINKDMNELKGLEVVRPAIALMQSVPKYVRYTVDNAPGDINITKEHITYLFRELKEKFELNFPDEVIFFSPQAIENYWKYMENSELRETSLWAYRHLTHDLLRLIVYTGDISGLITSAETESVYFISATIHEIPQTQERISLIGNLLRMTEGGTFTHIQSEEIQLHLNLLIHSDYPRIISRFNSAESLQMRQTRNFHSSETLLKDVLEKILYFSGLVEELPEGSNINIQSLDDVYEASYNANNSIYALQTASLERLDTLIKNRFNSHRLRLVLSLIAVFVSSFIAFIFIIITINSIRKSTHTMIKVFHRLDDNDLSVNIETHSNDELNQFMTGLGDFLKKLSCAFSSFRNSAAMVSTAVMEMSSSSMEITATANEQSSSIAEIVSTLENNKNLSAQASAKTDEVAHLASRTQELSSQGAELRDANENMMLDIRNQNEKIIDIIRNLADMLSRIDESIQLIDTIADHTKLIAFNAALEASSSGEAGARFSVVAGEIRRFADNVVESAAEIKEKITELQEASQCLIMEANNGTNAIDTGYKRMVEQKEVFENIVEVSKNVAERSMQISNLSKQQEFASAQVFLTLKEISSGVKQFVTVTAMTKETIENLNIMSKELKSTLEQYNTEKRSNS